MQDVHATPRRQGDGAGMAGSDGKVATWSGDI